MAASNRSPREARRLLRNIRKTYSQGPAIQRSIIWKRSCWIRRDHIRILESKIKMEHLRKLIREVPDFPKAGINFYDITTLLKDAEGLRLTIDALADLVGDQKVDTVIGVESRGFIF